MVTSHAKTNKKNKSKVIFENSALFDCCFVRTHQEDFSKLGSKKQPHFQILEEHKRCNKYLRLSRGERRQARREAALAWRICDAVYSLGVWSNLL